MYSKLVLIIVVVVVAGIIIRSQGVLGVSTVTCRGLKAAIPGKITASSEKLGEIVLKWNLSTNIDRYDLVYGLKPGSAAKDYQYGASKIGDASSNTYTVKGLTSGQAYHFRLATYCGGNYRPASLSGEVSAVAK